MKLLFDPNQNYQLEAIQAVIDLFDGQPLKEGSFAFSQTNDFSIITVEEPIFLVDENKNYLVDEDGNKIITGYEKLQQNSMFTPNSSQLFTVNGIGNNLILAEPQILENLQKVQARQNLTISESLDGLHFSIEMETGTGKTYVYLRTIYELNNTYGFTKFVIVVPSIAIREGVLKNLEITEEHLQTLYTRQPAEFAVYDTKNISYLRTFASSNSIQILVLNIDSFAKDENIINRPNDRLSGKNPIEFIQATNPIVIVDEPQRMETDNRKKAIENLNPLCTLRYSATHLKRYNQVYSLNPVQAYDLGLVKQIEVDSVVAENGFNEAYIQIEGFRSAKNSTSIRLTIDVNTDKGVKRKVVTAKIGSDLYHLSNQREIYRDGFIINAIDVADESIDLSNGERIYLGSPTGAMKDEIMKMQIRRMIDEHFKKAKRYEPDGIKVLSLVFIDRVANYRSYGDQGQTIPGKFTRWFEDLYQELASMPANQYVIPYSMDQVHDGYFSQDNKGRIKDTSGTTQADENTFDLIMKDKERLLDINTPLRFIFSHSALREGWDNPNIFQICTLNETRSEMKKRQEIGRGLRLCVNQDGQRVFDRHYNRLTVFANESYEDFAKQLQTEIEEETGVKFEGRIKNRNKREKVSLRKEYQLDEKFLDLWNKIKQKTTYRVNYDTKELIERTAKAIKNMPSINPPRIRAERGKIVMDVKEVRAEYAGSVKIEEMNSHITDIPDVLGYIQSRTNLTRQTILEILKDSTRLSDVLKNPQQFLDQVVHSIALNLQNMMVDGIKYQTIAGVEYDMRLFEAKEIESYIDDMYAITQPDKTISDYIVYDSAVEEQFAKDCENDDRVEFFIKLPDWFVIQTPIGTYNPDWALIFKNDKKLYFVAETKSVSAEATENLRRGELLKIKCGEAHFNEFPDVEYHQMKRVGDLIS